MHMAIIIPKEIMPVFIRYVARASMFRDFFVLDRCKYSERFQKMQAPEKEKPRTFSVRGFFECCGTQRDPCVETGWVREHLPPPSSLRVYARRSISSMPWRVAAPRRIVRQKRLTSSREAPFNRRSSSVPIN